MACCKCCCGGEDCEEGQQGKCCCGGSEGACCTEEQYCCDGECQSEPCEECSGPCDEENPCPEGCECVDGECVACAGCPEEFYNCRIRIFSDFGDFEQEWSNDTLAEQLEINGLQGQACAFEVIVSDIPSENCGNFNGVVVIGFDDECQCPVIKELIGFSAEEQIARQLAQWVENGDDPEDFPGCEPYPFSAEINSCEGECGGCYEQGLLGDEAYVDGWCETAATMEGFSDCEGFGTCGERTLVNDYGDGFGEWVVVVCCENPLP